MSIYSTILDSIQLINKYRYELGKALIINLSTLAILELAESKIAVPWNLLFSVIPFVFYALVAVTVHRIVLSGPASVPNWGITALSMRELNFMLKMFLSGVIVSLIFTAFTFLFTIFDVSIVEKEGGSLVYNRTVYIVCGIIAYYALGRISLVFPSIATDNPMTFSQSIELTKNHQLCMLTIVGIVPTMVVLVYYPLHNVRFGEIIIFLIHYISMIYLIAILSIAYKTIVLDSSHKLIDNE